MAKRTGPKNSRRKGKRAKINREERPKVSRIAALTDRDILYAGLATLTDREVQELGASLLSAHSPESLWVGLAIRFLETRGILSPDSVLLPDNPEIAKAKLTTLIDRELQAHPDFILSLFYPLRQRLLLELANMQGESGVQWFCGKWASRLPLQWSGTPHRLTAIRDELRRIWRMSNAKRLSFDTWSIEGTESDAHPDLLVSQILTEWLSWRPSPETTQGTVPGDEYIPFMCWIPSRQFVPDWRALRPMLVQGVLEHWGHFKYCANSDCASPYFIAKRKDQTVCDAEICKAEKQREHARRWWNENRSKKAQGKKNTGSNTAKEGSRGNVTRKTR